MMNIKWIPAILLAFLYIVFSCQSEVEEVTEDIDFKFSAEPTEPEGPLEDVCLEKESSEEIFPLQPGNQWKWYANGQLVSSMEVTDQEVMISGADYHKVQWTQGAENREIYMRKGAHEAIYLTNDTATAGKEWIPGPLEKGAYVIDSQGDSVVITNLNGSYSTPSCEYSGLLVLEEFKATETTLKQRIYLKKGLGPVVFEYPDSLEMYLKEVTIY